MAPWQVQRWMEDRTAPLIVLSVSVPSGELGLGRGRPHHVVRPFLIALPAHPAIQTCIGSFLSGAKYIRPGRRYDGEDRYPGRTGCPDGNGISVHAGRGRGRPLATAGRPVHPGARDADPDHRAEPSGDRADRDHRRENHGPAGADLAADGAADSASSAHVANPGARRAARVDPERADCHPGLARSTHSGGRGRAGDPVRACPTHGSDRHPDELRSGDGRRRAAGQLRAGSLRGDDPLPAEPRGGGDPLRGRDLLRAGPAPADDPLHAEPPHADGPDLRDHVARPGLRGAGLARGPPHVLPAAPRDRLRADAVYPGLPQIPQYPPEPASAQWIGSIYSWHTSSFAFMAHFARRKILAVAWRN